MKKTDKKCKDCGDGEEWLNDSGYKLYNTKEGLYCYQCAEDNAIHYNSKNCVCDECFDGVVKNE